MYTKNKMPVTTLRVNASKQGETIENKIRRIVNNKEPITDGASLIYSERKDGTLPETNIRTDRWEVAVEAMDIENKNRITKREAKIIEMQKKQEAEDGKTESAQGQGDQNPTT